MIFCSNCGAENRADAKFCGECGAGLAALCPACSTPNEPGRKFCYECGVRARKARLCALTFFCSRRDLHPTDAGYRAMAEAFMAASGYPRKP